MAKDEKLSKNGEKYFIDLTSHDSSSILHFNFFG